MLYVLVAILAFLIGFFCGGIGIILKMGLLEEADNKGQTKQNDAK